MECKCSATNISTGQAEECGCMSCATGRARVWSQSSDPARRPRAERKRGDPLLDKEALCWTCDVLRGLGLDEAAAACEAALGCPEEEEEPDEGDHLDIFIPDCPNEAVSVYPASGRCSAGGP